MPNYPYTDSKSIDEKILTARTNGGEEDVCKVRAARDIYYNLALSFIDRRPQAVLDTGCYQGAFTHRIATETGARRVVGVDASAEAVAIAGSRYPDLHFVAADFEDCELDGPFDYIFAMGWLHIKEAAGIARCLERMLELLSPTGRVVITGGYGNWTEGQLEDLLEARAACLELLLEVTYDKHRDYALGDTIRFSKKHFMWLLGAKDARGPEASR